MVGSYLYNSIIIIKICTACKAHLIRKYVRRHRGVLRAHAVIKVVPNFLFIKKYFISSIIVVQGNQLLQTIVSLFYRFINYPVTSAVIINTHPPSREHMQLALLGNYIALAPLYSRR